MRLGRAHPAQGGVEPRLCLRQGELYIRIFKLDERIADLHRIPFGHQNFGHHTPRLEGEIGELQGHNAPFGQNPARHRGGWFVYICLGHWRGRRLAGHQKQPQYPK